MTDRRFIRHQHIDSNGERMQVQCRFCRLKQQYNKYDYICPCACAGNTRYVHRECLERWFVTKFEHVFNGDYEGDPLEFNVHCEVCQQRMEIEFSLVNKCSNYDEFVQNLEQHKLWFLFMVIVGVIIICLLIFLIVFSQSANSSSIIAILIVVCVVVLIMDLIGFFWKFALINSIQIQKIPNNKDPPKMMAYQADINQIEDQQQQQSQPRPNPRFGNQPYYKDSYADKSLMLESKRNSGSQYQDSRVSKTLTDIVMKKMYQHDSHLKSNELLIQDRKSRSKRNSIKEESRKSSYKPVMHDQDLQVTIHQQPKHMIPISMTFQRPQVEDKGIQMTVYEPMSTPVRSESKSRRRIFEEQLPETPKLYQKNTPETKPSKVSIDVPPELNSIPVRPKSKSRAKPEPQPEPVQDSYASDVQSEPQFNLIKQTPSQIQETTPQQKERDMVPDVRSKMSPAEPNKSKIPDRSDNGTRIKLKKNNPIKIKVAY